MKVLDESGVKKIVKNYKDADKNINNNITQINSFLDYVKQTYDPTTNYGFALYGLSNKEDSLIIPITDDQHVCFTVEGTQSPILGKIYVNIKTAVFVNRLSVDVMVDKIATFHDSNGQFSLIIEQNPKDPVLIKPVINSNGNYLPGNDDGSIQLVKENNIQDIADKYGDGTYDAFAYDQFSNYSS